MAIDLGFQMKYILNLWYLPFNPMKVLLKVFWISFKILSAICGQILLSSIFPCSLFMCLWPIYLSFFITSKNILKMSCNFVFFDSKLCVLKTQFSKISKPFFYIPNSRQIFDPAYLIVKYTDSLPNYWYFQHFILSVIALQTFVCVWDKWSIVNYWFWA